MNKENSPKDYKHIRAWGQMMGSYPYYIKNQQQEAFEDNAPIDAVYKRGDTWHCFSEVTSIDTRNTIEKILKENG